jgi:hypothetical protein
MVNPCALNDSVAIDQTTMRSNPRLIGSHIWFMSVSATPGPMSSGAFIVPSAKNVSSQHLLKACSGFVHALSIGSDTDGRQLVNGCVGRLLATLNPPNRLFDLNKQHPIRRSER